jgi:hypothetical protein
VIDFRGAYRQSADDVTLLFSGDLVLDAERPDHWLAGIAPALRSADIAIGHLEVPHTWGYFRESVCYRMSLIG